ncbi:MAG: hypothetical protein A4E72_01553 [Syntrophus sp. PtaU1.Bin208]|nr:MAG: hypothetical protein A4E72_01553 [Syntrophus sp. PtaU1.Bin208]
MKVPYPDELLSLIQQESSKDTPAGLNPLVEAIRIRHGEAVQAILFYGSCLRSGQEKEGIIDLYVLVDAYRSAYGQAFFALLNWLLPPNVFYLEVPDGEGKIRAKYAVLTLADFARGTSPAWFHPYLWARFSQPVRLVYVCSEKAARQIHAALGQSVITFFRQVLPQIPSPFGARDLWCGGLSLSYRSELRPEKKEQPLRLFEGAPEYFESVTRNAMDAVPFEMEATAGSGPARYRSNISAGKRLLNRLAWQLRRVQGKGLSVLRLAKALFTFQGGLDYILWKIERHSGVGIPQDSALRRHPLGGIWVMIWQLYRRGGFR